MIFLNATGIRAKRENFTVSMMSGGLTMDGAALRETQTGEWMDAAWSRTCITLNG